MNNLKYILGEQPRPHPIALEQRLGSFANSQIDSIAEYSTEASLALDLWAKLIKEQTEKSRLVNDFISRELSKV